ncbi:putative cyclase [Fistulina hepatica ATCC 64428]|uniref:Putative cyclase n=1 Tax=Fistulina hepatica ATCC 64428 TaxID=1128425 RepID=A0A0D7A737_9AGAR|nr:putative cyclase [Fistulina hepatica ATCC 64428]
METVIDLSHKLGNNVPVYPGDSAMSCVPVCTIADDEYSVHQITMGSHTGTHIDAPSHFIPSAKSISDISPSHFVRPIIVANLAGRLLPRQKITWDKHLAPYSAMMHPSVVLIIRTGWSNYWGTPVYFDHPYLDAECAQKIVDAGIRIVALDTPSPDRTPREGESSDYPAHKTILGAGGIIAENLTNLDQLPERGMTISLMPLNIEDCDGAPVRAFAWRTGDL